MTMTAYIMAWIHIYEPEALGVDSYPVVIETSGGRRSPPGVLRLDQEALRLELDPAKYGQALGQQLCADLELLTYLRELSAVAGGRLRIALQLDPVALHGLHWERLFLPSGGAWLPVALGLATPFSRFVSTASWREPLVPVRPPRVLAVIASPHDGERYGLTALSGADRQNLAQALAPFGPGVTYLDRAQGQPPTLQRLAAALLEGYDLVHILCHGRAGEEPILYLEQENGATAPTTGPKLLETLLLAAAPPELVVLTACESAVGGTLDPRTALGYQMVSAGAVSHCVAMSEKVSIPSANTFITAFYQQLRASMMVDLAANHARALVREHWDWGAPVVISRAPAQPLRSILPAPAKVPRPAPVLNPTLEVRTMFDLKLERSQAQRLRQLLLKCDEFEDIQLLRSLFSDDSLRPWHSGLPSADNPRALVDRTIAYLRPHFRTTGESALVTFIELLSERREDDLGFQLAAFADELRTNIVH